MNIPNALSLLRLIMVPVFALLFWMTHPRIAGIIMIASIATDILDGYIARKYNLITYLGMILDPLADKLMQTTVCLCIGFWYKIFWLPVVFILKELFMLIGGYVIIRTGRKIVPSRWYGKLAAVVFFAATSAIIFFLPASRLVTNVILLIAFFFMFFAFVMYVPVFLRINKEKVE